MRPDSREEVLGAAQAIDHEIHDLLERRFRRGIEDTSASPAFFPAAQSATILRTVLARHSGGFPPDALVHIWSEILFACHNQTTLHVFAGEDAPGFRDLARTHFGSMLPIVGHVSATAVVHACADDASSIGLVPSPESAGNGPAWWDQLAPAGHPGPRIAQFLPFVRNGRRRAHLPEGYSIAAVEQTFTGRDTTILRVECPAEMSRARLQSILRRSGFDSHILAGSRDSVRSVANRLLVASRGFVAADDKRLAELAAIAEETIDSVAVVGGFADPFEFPSGS